MESQAARPDLAELEGDPGARYFGDGWRPLAELLDAPRPADTVYVNLAPDLVYGLYQAVSAAVARRLLVIAHNRTEGLRSAAEQATLRTVAAPRFEVVKIARSWRGSPFTLVELRGDGAPRDEREVYREAASIVTARVASCAFRSSSEAGIATA